MDTNIGKIIKNRYEILKKISVGGTSYIYLIYDQILNRKCVLKILFQNIFANQKKEDFFKNEIKITAQLKHKNIAKLYDYFKFNGLWCLVLEYVKGITLREYLNQKKVLNEEKIIQIFGQILETLIYTNNQKIIHRDIKPENIIIVDNKKIKILDFGIAIDKYFDFKLENTKAVGSLKYLAPEIIAKNEVTIKSDIYSLGLILYEALIGQHPFSGFETIDIIKKHLYQKLFRIRKFDKTISQSMENIVIKATAKNSDERYQNPEEMKKDLDNILNFKLKNPTPLFLKNEIYVGTLNNKFFIKNLLKSKKHFWLTKKWTFLIFSINIILFFIFIVVLLMMINKN